MKKEFIKIGSINGCEINILAREGSLGPEVSEEIEKGVKKALDFFNSLNQIKLEIEFIYSREEFDEYLGQKTENWAVARAFENKFIIFAPEEIEKQTSHKKSEFSQIICHETCHIFLQNLNPDFSFWMFEGIALNVAGQAKKGEVKKENIEFFLSENLFKNTNYENFISKQGYLISYSLVKNLLDNYGKQVVMKLLKIKYKNGKSAKKEFCKIVSLENFLDYFCDNGFLLHGSIHKIKGNKIISKNGKIFASNRSSIAIMRSLYSNEGVNLQYPYFMDKNNLKLKIHTKNEKYIKKDKGFVYILKSDGFVNEPKGSWQFIKKSGEAELVAVIETENKDFSHPVEIFYER